MPTESRLARSSNAQLKTTDDIRRFCDAEGIPYSNADTCLKTALPTPELRDAFHQPYFRQPGKDLSNPGYTQKRLSSSALQEHGSSTILVFEPKGTEDPAIVGNTNYSGRNHGEVVAAVAHTVGASLQPGVDTLYLHTSANPHSRQKDQPELFEPVKRLIENQGIPVIHTSLGWDDGNFHFDQGHDDQEQHLWNVTAFLVDSAGNDGQHSTGNITNYRPTQKHNALSHFPPLVVHVGAASYDHKAKKFNIDGYSSANSPTFLVPVVPSAKAQWDPAQPPGDCIGTSLAGYASGVLAALNQHYGAYLTREQILYAVLATCFPVEHVNAFTPKTKNGENLTYKVNKAGFFYDDRYGGFGMIDPHLADSLLAQMVAVTQANPESITIPTEDIKECDFRKSSQKPDAQGNYHYIIDMPEGIALKTTLEVEFANAHGDITLTSPAGTTLNMCMSFGKAKKEETDPNLFELSTTHGFLGEELKGRWEVSSKAPISRLQLRQHHFQEKDIVNGLDTNALLAKPTPDLSHAKPLTELSPLHHIFRQARHTDAEVLSENPDTGTETTPAAHTQNIQISGHASIEARAPG